MNVEILKEDYAYQFYILKETPFNINVSLHTYLKWHDEHEFPTWHTIFTKLSFNF